MAKENKANANMANGNKAIGSKANGNKDGNNKANQNKPNQNKAKTGNKKANAKRNPPNARLVSLISLGVILVLILCTALLAFNGFGQGRLVHYMQPWHKAIGLGLDLRGGVSAVYQAKQLEGEAGNTALPIDQAVDMLRNRLAEQGIAEAAVSALGEDRIRVEMPGTLADEALLDTVFTRALFEVKDPDGNTMVESKHIQSVRVVSNTNQVGGKYVEFTLTPEGKQLYADGTKANVGKTLSIELDGQALSSLSVDAAVTSGKIYLGNGVMAEAQANSLASMIRLGALPLELERTEMAEVSATLGAEAAGKIVTALLIALALIAAFMLVRYRVFGAVAVIALAIYSLLVLFLLAVFGAQLSLPGVVGIAISLCLVADGNVLLLERHREDAKGGRAARNKLQSAYVGVRPAILDASIVAIIVALVLLQFGTGAIRGLALTLVIGVATSLFTVMFISRWLLKLIADIGAGNRQSNVG